jgi:transposase
MAIENPAADPVGPGEDGHTTVRMNGRRQRIEVITRDERRRSWTIEQKREIAAESLGSELSPTAVARKHDVNPSLLFTWRRQLLAGQLGPAPQPAPNFARVDVAPRSQLVAPGTPAGTKPASVPEATNARPGSAGTAGCTPLSGLIEISLPSGALVRVDAQVDGRALQRVLAALEKR